MNIRPLADRVLVKPAAAEEKTVSGIIIPDSAEEKCNCRWKRYKRRRNGSKRR